MKSKSITWLDKLVIKSLPNFTIEHRLISLIILLAVTSCLAGLGERKALTHPFSETYG